MESSKSDSKFSGIIRKIDAFSMPFQFCVQGQQKTCRTFVGGFITLIVYLVSLVYFIYITNLYFTTGYQPKVSTIDLSQNEDSFLVDNDSFAFNFFVQGEGNIQQIELQTGKKYLSFLVLYQYFDEDLILKTKILQTIKCQDPDLQDYLCIDFSALPSQVALKYNYSQSSVNQEGFQIIFLKCSGNQNCAIDEDIDNILYNSYNRRYNMISQNVEIVRQINSYILDQYIGTRHLIHLIKSKTTLIEGFILQKRSINNYLDNFEEFQEVKWIQSLQQQIKMPIIGQILISMSNKQRYITIQFPLYTETFAQFMSVFAILTIIGKIGQNCSEIEIYQELSNIFLKKYYQQTAIKAYQQFIAPKSNQNELELQNLESVSDKNTEKIKNLNQNINKIFFPEQIHKFLNFGVFKKLQILYKKEIPAEFLDDKPIQLKQVYNIIKNTYKYINLAEFYKDIIQIKLIVRLLLTKEQFSAIKYCGLDIQKIVQQKNELQINNQFKRKDKEEVDPFKQNKDILLTDEQLKDNQIELQTDQKEDKNLSKKQSQIILQPEPKMGNSSQNEIDFLNHLEQIESIDHNDELAHQYFAKYIKQINQQQNISELDNRILNCIVKPQEEEYESRKFDKPIKSKL